ncbi:MAG: preprotein translocase subunit SecE [Planctomycetota bacterium]
MNVGIYKASQGYWVRAMTAVMAGALFLAGAAWAWSQAAAVSLPIAAYTLNLGAVRGEAPAVGATVDIIGITKDAREERVDIGDAIVEEYTFLGQNAGALRVGQVVVTADGFDEGDISRVAVGGAVFEAEVRSRRPHTAFPLIYVQAGVAGVLILIGAVLVYWFVGLNRKSVDFLIATDGEMKKVNWTTRKEIIGNTQVVVVAAFLIAAILFGIDNVFRFFFTEIGVLDIKV